MNEQVDSTEKPISALRGGVFIAILIAFCFGLIFSAMNEIAMLARIKQGVALVKVKTILPPLLVMLPAFLVLVWGIFLQVKQTMTPKKQKSGLIFVIACFPVFLLVWLIYNTQVMNLLGTHGYSQCQWYSGATIGAAKVMVRERDFCIKDGYQVRIDLLDWFESQHQAGQKPTVEQARNKQSELLAKYKKRFEVL